MPCPLDILTSLEDAALEAIWKNKSKTVSTRRLHTPLQNGGFGLIPLEQQFQGQRAKWVFSLLQSSAFDHPHLLAIRALLEGKLLQEKPFIKSQLDMQTGKREVLFHYHWFGLFCQPGIEQKQWPQATFYLKSLLPARWLEYLEAWNSLVCLQSSILPDWDKVILVDRPINGQIPMKIFKAFNGGKVNAALFDQTREKLVSHHFKIIIPSGWVKHFPNLGQGKKWQGRWNSLSKLRSKLPEAVNLAHLLSLYSLHPGHQVFKVSNQHPNNSTPICQLCLEPNSLENFDHLFTKCQVSRTIWKACNPPHPDPPQLANLICPSTLTPPKLQALQCLYIQAIWKLVSSRRWSEGLVNNLVQSQLLERGKKLERTWKSLNL